MRKSILAVFPAVILITSVPSLVVFPTTAAHAQSANDWIRYQEATDPAYRRAQWDYGYNSYPLPLVPYFHDTEKKGGSKTKFNGRDMQYCRSSQWGPAGQIEPGQPCPVVSLQGGPSAQPPVESGYWEEDQDQKCYVVPSGERGVTRYCNKK